MHPLRRLAEKREVGVRASAGGVVLTAVSPSNRALVEAAFGCEIRLNADDGFDSAFVRLFPELECPEQSSVVGHSNSGHALCDGGVEQRSDSGSAVEHGVVGVYVQVHETFAHNPSFDVRGYSV